MACLTCMQCRRLSIIMYLDGYAVRHTLREEVRVWNIKILVPLFDLGGDVLQAILEALHHTLGPHFCKTVTFISKINLRRGERYTIYCK